MENNEHESDWTIMMKKVVLSIEAQIGDHLSRNHTPVAIVATDSSIKQIEDYAGIQIDWSNPIMLFGDGEIELKVIRTVDLKNGVVWVL